LRILAMTTDGVAGRLPSTTPWRWPKKRSRDRLRRRRTRRLRLRQHRPGWEPLVDPHGRAITARLRPSTHIRAQGTRRTSTWRKTGASLRLHDTLLAGCTEPRVTLLLNPKAGDGKVQTLYAIWGNGPFNRQTPSPAPRRW
jgi:hypothetical protein